MTRNTKTILKRKEEANVKAITNVKEAISMQLKETKAVCSTEIAELKAEIAIFLVEKYNGVRSEKSKERSACMGMDKRDILETLSAGTTILFQVITDTSVSYNPSDGIFTVPVSGVYVFTWSASCGEGRWQDTELFVESIAYGYLKVNTVEKKYSESSMQTVVLAV
ncbi:C1QL [Mytilus edulis]|uniref:C1QL n=1 Tax=Mytilus edulis TaxID=6550 RepID=A0A8S3UHW1_MYTED|nr:C1QL [Mytilus edulis]